ncbi:MAG: hypothetical protein ACE5GZ_13600, partial [Gammaproteobacteria bacterium]
LPPPSMESSCIHAVVRRSIDSIPGVVWWGACATIMDDGSAEYAGAIICRSKRIRTSYLQDVGKERKQERKLEGSPSVEVGVNVFS